jgi:hypothetical protein
VFERPDDDVDVPEMEVELERLNDDLDIIVILPRSRERKKGTSWIGGIRRTIGVEELWVFRLG